MGPIEPTIVFTSARIDPEVLAGSPAGCFAGDGPKRFTHGAPALLAIRISGGVSGINTSTPKRANSVIVIYSPGDMKPRDITSDSKRKAREFLAPALILSLSYLFFLLAINALIPAAAQGV